MEVGEEAMFKTGEEGLAEVEVVKVEVVEEVMVMTGEEGLAVVSYISIFFIHSFSRTGPTSSLFWTL